MKTHEKNTLINVISLGCSKNLVDSEHLLAQLKASNLNVVHNSQDPEVRTVIINTCGFIRDAKQESIDTILEYIHAKEMGTLDHVFVMGCLSQRYKDQLRNEIPEIDKLFGVNNLPEILTALRGNYKTELIGERVITTPGHYAYLKISEGCDRMCSFCAIPGIRGRHISKHPDEIVNEAKFLVRQGVKEIILIAQDLTYYGLDIYKRQSLADLLESLAGIKGLKWLRLHYAYPASFPTDVLRVVRDHENICNYLDIPFQHISDKVLQNMRRGINKKQTYELIHLVQSEIPGLTLRTTLLVGHPGEEEKDFNELMKFVGEVKFDRLGVFPYSEEEGTYSARHYPDKISEKAKEKRVSAIMELQEKLSLEKNTARVGHILKTIIDRIEGDGYIGRTESDSPEVDNEVIIRTDKPLTVGEFYNIKITEAESFDLFGELADIKGLEK
jgi:ribosomal protein S12 methylthiotransferase